MLTRKPAPGPDTFRSIGEIVDELIDRLAQGAVEGTSARSSVDRAPAFESGGRAFDSHRAHQPDEAAE